MDHRLLAQPVPRRDQAPAPPAAASPRRRPWFGTNLVWLEIAALVALIVFWPSPAVLIGGLMAIWGTACWVGYAAGANSVDARAVGVIRR